MSPENTLNIVDEITGKIQIIKTKFLYSAILCHISLDITFNFLIKNLDQLV